MQTNTTERHNLIAKLEAVWEWMTGVSEGIWEDQRRGKVNNQARVSGSLYQGGVSPGSHESQQTPDLIRDFKFQIPPAYCWRWGSSHPTRLCQDIKEGESTFGGLLYLQLNQLGEDRHWLHGIGDAFPQLVLKYSTIQVMFKVLALCNFFNDRDYSIAICATIIREGSAFPLLTLYFQSHKIYNLLKCGMQSQPQNFSKIPAKTPSCH